jgi:hypothetical protein
MTNWSNTPTITVTQNGLPIGQHDAQLNQAGRPLMTVLDDDEGVNRRVAPGRSLDWGGKHFAAGSIVRLPALRAADLMRTGVLVHLEHDATPQRQPSVTYGGGITVARSR